jgi:hypothetical protein
MNAKRPRLNSLIAKIAMIFLASIYTFFSIGVIKATHFCMGRQASVALFTTQPKECPCSIYAMEKDSCCDDEHDLIRIENEQKVLSPLTLSLPQWIEFRKLYVTRLVALAVKSDLPWHDQPEHSPRPKVPLWKFHCSIVFYDDQLIG